MFFFFFFFFFAAYILTHNLRNYCNDIIFSYFYPLIFELYLISDINIFFFLVSDITGFINMYSFQIFSHAVLFEA